MPGPMNDAGYCVTAAVATTAISSSAKTTHITAHPPILLLHGDKCHMKQAESMPIKLLIRDTCSSPWAIQKVRSPFRATLKCQIFFWTCLSRACSWTEGPNINSSLPQNSVTVRF